MSNRTEAIRQPGAGTGAGSGVRAVANTSASAGANTGSSSRAGSGAGTGTGADTGKGQGGRRRALLRLWPDRRLGTKIREQWSNFWVGAILPIAIVAAWQIAGDRGWISTFFLPTPLTISQAFRDLFVSGELTQHLGISLKRALIGFAIGGGAGFLLGVAVGFVRKLELLLDPSVQMLRMIPHLAIAPLIILWFGFGETSKFLIIAKGAFFPLYVNTFLGIRSVDNKLFEVSRVLQFGRLSTLVKLIVPAALPNILLGLRLSLAISWLGLVVAELIGSQSGIGFLINFAKQNSTTELIFVGVILFAIIGKLVDSLVRLLERRWLSWRDSYEG